MNIYLLYTRSISSQKEGSRPKISEIACLTVAPLLLPTLTRYTYTGLFPICRAISAHDVFFSYKRTFNLACGDNLISIMEIYANIMKLVKQNFHFGVTFFIKIWRFRKNKYIQLVIKLRKGNFISEYISEFEC